MAYSNAEADNIAWLIKRELEKRGNDDIVALFKERPDLYVEYRKATSVPIGLTVKS